MGAFKWPPKSYLSKWKEFLETQATLILQNTGIEQSKSVTLTIWMHSSAGLAKGCYIKNTTRAPSIPRQWCFNKATRLIRISKDAETQLTYVEVSHENPLNHTAWWNSHKTHLAPNKFNTLSATLKEAFGTLPKSLQNLCGKVVIPTDASNGLHSMPKISTHQQYVLAMPLFKLATAVMHGS